MSDNIPFEIQEEIMKRLPIKSLIQFRLVSKPWKSLIDSPKFIANHTLRHAQPHHLLVAYSHPADDSFKQQYVSIIDDHTFPQQKLPLTVPMSAKTLYRPRIAGSSQGLFCLYSFNEDASYSGMKKAVIWNPTIRKSVVIDVPNMLDRKKYNTSVGFGVCPETLDPMIVNISWGRTITDTYLLVEVFRLSSGIWKSLSVNFSQRIALLHFRVVIGRFIYWHGLDMTSRAYLIISFDMISEEVKEIRLPDNLALNLDPDHEMLVYICNLKDSLVVLHTEADMEEVSDFDVWMMENSDPKSFKKIYTIKSDVLSDARIESVFGSRKTGEPIVEVTKFYTLDEEDSELSVYDPNSEHIGYIGISAQRSSIFASSYTETLLLLDH